MNNIIFYGAYLFLTVLFYLPSLWASSAWSGSGFSKWKFSIMAVYNVFFICFHRKYIEQGKILFVGEADNSVLGWVSLFMILLYMFTMPVEWERRGGFFGVKK